MKDNSGCHKTCFKEIKKSTKKERKIKKINEKVFVQVIWKCKKDDVDMASSGMRFSKLLNLEFEVREEE